MNLIDILVEELPKCGGWDAKWHQCAQDGNGEVCFFTSGEIHFRGIFDAWSIPSDSVSRHDGKARLEELLADDYSETIITREQYESALAAKNDGWIEWGGGKMPVDSATEVDIKFRTGGIASGVEAGKYRWPRIDHEYDIVAYRLHQSQDVAHTEAEQEVDLNECIGQDAAPVWNGEGLPPVGCECECQFRGEWQKCTILFSGKQIVVVMVGDDEYPFESKGSLFLPIRSEADRKRDDICDKIYGAMTNAKRKDNRSDMAEEIYDAIAAGKIPGVKLDD